MTPEGRVKAIVKAVLADHADNLYYEMPVPSGYGKPSLDFIGSYRGHAFAVETKRPGQELTPRQEATVEDMLQGGVRVFVVHDADEAAVIRMWFETLDRKARRACS